MERRIFLVLALLLLPPATRGAGDAPLDRATLRGLKGIGVVIDVLDPELQKLGITRDALITRLLARLQGDGITMIRAPPSSPVCASMRYAPAAGPLLFRWASASTSPSCFPATTICGLPPRPGKWRPCSWPIPKCC